MIVGLDMGGTHIDGVVMQDGQVLQAHKRPVDKDDLFNTIWTTLEEILPDGDLSMIKRINLSTTLSTNAIVEHTTPAVGMIIQSGPGIIHDLSFYKGVVKSVSGYVDHRGVVVDDLDKAELQRAYDFFEKEKIQNTAVVGKFSTRNPSHETTIGNRLQQKFGQVTLGHRMSGALNFPRRIHTSYLNSAVSSQFAAFVAHLTASLAKKGIDAPLYILKADAGTMDSERALLKPVESILSGPAASFLGLSALVPSKEDTILLDVGGTTTDIFFLADGVPLFEPLGATISEYKTLVRAIFSVSIGMGGDSSLAVENGKLAIGPLRRGRAYAFGGDHPTPTDAMIHLDLIKVDQEARRNAAKSMHSLGKKVALSSDDVATLTLVTMIDGIKDKTDELLRGINSKPVYTMKELFHGKKVVPKAVHVIGGPAEALAPFLEEAFALPCRFPENYHVANAIGAALAKPTVELSLFADTALGKLMVPELGIYEDIGRTYSLKQAKGRALDLVREAAHDGSFAEVEITEESSFNMVEGFSTIGKNIRVKAQVKPGIISTLRSDNRYES